MAQGDFWNKLKKRLVEVSTATADFTEEQALIGKLKYDILILQRKVDRKQREIGVRICELSKEDPKPVALNDGDVIRLVAEIEGLEKQITRKRQDITRVADQVRSKRTETQEEKTVPGTVTPEPHAETPKPESTVTRGRRRGTVTKTKATRTRRGTGTSAAKPAGTTKPGAGRRGPGRPKGSKSTKAAEKKKTGKEKSEP